MNVRIPWGSYRWLDLGDIPLEVLLFHLREPEMPEDVVDCIVTELLRRLLLLVPWYDSGPVESSIASTATLSGDRAS